VSAVTLRSRAWPSRNTLTKATSSREQDYATPLWCLFIEHAIGDPIEENGVPWTFSRVASAPNEGEVRFQASANRKLRIEIRDWMIGI
jgi:hypothetical protein